jgi:hypothetical protein
MGEGITLISKVFGKSWVIVRTLKGQNSKPTKDSNGYRPINQWELIYFRLTSIRQGKNERGMLVCIL